MFRIQELPHVPPTPRALVGNDRTELGPVDVERGVWARGLSYLVRTPTLRSLLSVHGRLIPFDMYSEYEITRTPALFDLRIDANQFGAGYFTCIELGLEPVIFTSKDEREAALMLAIEAMLVWHTYKANRSPIPVTVEVQSLDRVWTIDDFDYAPATI